MATKVIKKFSLRCILIFLATITSFVYFYSKSRHFSLRDFDEKQKKEAIQNLVQIGKNLNSYLENNKNKLGVYFPSLTYSSTNFLYEGTKYREDPFLKKGYVYSGIDLDGAKVEEGKKINKKFLERTVPLISVNGVAYDSINKKFIVPYYLYGDFSVRSNQSLYNLKKNNNVKRNDLFIFLFLLCLISIVVLFQSERDNKRDFFLFIFKAMSLVAIFTMIFLFFM